MQSLAQRVVRGCIGGLCQGKSQRRSLSRGEMCQRLSETVQGLRHCQHGTGRSLLVGARLTLIEIPGKRAVQLGHRFGVDGMESLGQLAKLLLRGRDGAQGSSRARGLQ
jgi:hypothetical protein